MQLSIALTRRKLSKEPFSIYSVTIITGLPAKTLQWSGISNEHVNTAKEVFQKHVQIYQIPRIILPLK